MINAIAGVSKIQTQDFAIGSLIGMLPGIAAIVIVTDRVSEALHRPNLYNLAALLGAVVIFGIGLFLLFRWLRQKHSKKKKSTNADF
jgi:uncharacterized membrane protein YdjX (TVP38/TMEM64 family)